MQMLLPDMFFSLAQITDDGSTHQHSQTVWWCCNILLLWFSYLFLLKKYIIYVLCSELVMMISTDKFP